MFAVCALFHLEVDYYES